MSEEKKLTDEEIVKALDICYNDVHCSIDCPYFNLNGRNFCQDKELYKDLKRIVLEHSEQKAEIERLKDNLSNEKKWGKIQAKQAKKETAREILNELDLFFKGTTFRQGYEFKKIDEKLKEMAKNYDVGVDYEN